MSRGPRAHRVYGREHPHRTPQVKTKNDCPVTPVKMIKVTVA